VSHLKPVDAQAHFAATMSEKTLSQRVVERARARGWKVARWPAWRATGTDPGVPDLLLARGGVVIFAELKTQKGTLSPAQGDWFNELQLVQEAIMGFSGLPYEPRANKIPAQCAAIFGVYIWRPMDLLDGSLEEVLA